MPPREGRADLPDEQRLLDLFGAWIVEVPHVLSQAPAFEGGWDIVLLVGNRQLEVLSQCVTIGPFDYGRTTGGGIAVREPAAPPGPQAARSPPPPQCARTRSPAEQALPPLLLTAEKVVPQTNGAVMITGPRGGIWLARPARAIANPRGEHPAPAVPPLLGAWQVERVDGRSLSEDERMELLLRPRHIDWRSGCVNETRRIERDRNLILPGEIDPFPVCERGRSEGEIAVGRLLAGPISTRMRAPGRLTLSGSGVTVELVPLNR